MCSIISARVNDVNIYFHWLRTPDSITYKKTAHLSNYFVQIQIIQWINIARIFIDHVRKCHNILQKSRLVSIIHVWILVYTYIRKQLHTPSQKPPDKSHNTPLHCYVSIQSYIQPLLAQEKNYYFIHNNPRKKSSHFIFSCPNISLFGKVIDNTLAAYQHMVVGTLQIWISGPEPPIPARYSAN